jgi:hypothetical protein
MMSPSDVPGPTVEPFIAVNVPADATREEIADAIRDALREIPDAYFQYATPKYLHWLQSGSGKGDNIPLGKGLQIMVRHEGP